MRIGIDPDLTKSGVAIIEQGKITQLNNLRFLDLIAHVVAMHQSQASLAVLLEDVDNKKPVFPKRLHKGAVKGHNPLLQYVGHSGSNTGNSQAINLSIAEDLGKVKATARLIKEALEHHGVRVILVKPLRGPIKTAKKNSAYFNKLTGWTGRSNEDNRDAALLALFGS
jgi:hypothetical protein